MPLSIQNFITQTNPLPLIDVRSEGEFTHGHITGATNIPLFDNAERALVGTCYKQNGKDAAVLLGLEIVGPKLASFIRKVKEIAPNNEVLVHCWRGGMRSGSFAWLLNTAGIKANVLVGGYKAYRQFVQQSFETPLNLIVLGGSTGSGKTEVLQELKQIGEQVIDLEGIAHHKGSVFGALGQLPQPSTEQFENLLFEQWKHLDPNRRTWIEDESRRIGTVYLDQRIWEQLRKAPVMVLQVPRDKRVEFLVKNYGKFDFEQLERALTIIQKRLGGQHYLTAIEALKSGDLAMVADISLNYYDKAYQHGLSLREASHTLVPVADTNHYENAKALIKALEERDEV